MRRNKHLLFEESSDEPFINLTPLIDVVFVVLISFIILAPILNVESVDLASSGIETTLKEPKINPFSISIQKDGSLIFQKKKESLASIRKALLTMNKNAPPQVIPDKNAPFGVYQEVKNMLEEAGFKEMEILLKP